MKPLCCLCSLFPWLIAFLSIASMVGVHDAMPRQLRLRDPIDVSWDDFNRIRNYIALNFIALRRAVKNTTTATEEIITYKNRLAAELVADYAYLHTSAARLIKAIEDSANRNFPIKLSNASLV